jgi:Ca-activated chloride channel homolog
MRLPFGVDLAQPWFLLGLLLVVPALWWSRRSAGRVVFSSLRALPGGGQTWRTRLAWLPDAMFALAVISLVIALTGPRAGDKTSRVRREGIAIALAVDVSGSMKAQDLAGASGASCDRSADDQTRLGVVKRAFEQFVLGGKGLRGRPDDAIGLVAFASYAETRSPLTLDHGNLVTAARQLEFAPDDESGTRIGNGLALAIERLREFKKGDKVARIAILLTDGETTIRDENTIDEDTAIDQAIEAGVKVYTIGAGKKGTAPICVDDMDGRGRLRQMQVSIDEATLGKIAEKTGGAYFRAENGAALRHIYSQIDKLERTTIEEERFTEYHQYYVWFVAAALLLLTVALLLRGTVLRRLP